MRVIIIEDEAPAAKRLTGLLQHISPGIGVIATLDSVEAAVHYLPSAVDIDLLFMDIQLADGLSFSIFEQVKLTTPVIFTTAFDQYTLKAFKVNSLDYLLKPIDETELRKAVEKYRQLYPKTDKSFSDRMEKLAQEMGAAYKERLLVKRGRQLHYLRTDAIAYYYADGKLCYAIEFNGNRHLLENNLGQLEELLAPRQFYRVNRHLLVNIGSIKKIHTWFGGRLKLELTPPAPAETLVSRERVGGFKEWLGR
jgi:DNA-binding LytR/AlgR family response regulator